MRVTASTLWHRKRSGACYCLLFPLHGIGREVRVGVEVGLFLIASTSLHGWRDGGGGGGGPLTVRCGIGREVDGLLG